MRQFGVKIEKQIQNEESEIIKQHTNKYEFVIKLVSKL